MKHTYDEFRNALKQKNIHPTYHRLKVLVYLSQNRNHPTADQIYTGLHQSIPTLSKTTVYNTLRRLVEAGTVREITIEGNEVRYDIEGEDHGHFKCEECGTIYNFGINHDALAAGDLNGFQVHDRQVHFKGICPACLKNSSQEVKK